VFPQGEEEQLFGEKRIKLSQRATSFEEKGINLPERAPSYEEQIFKCLTRKFKKQTLSKSNILYAIGKFSKRRYLK
jgi:hypothetical protein